VIGTIGDGRTSDAPPARKRRFVSGTTQLSAEGKLRRAVGASRGIPFAAERNVVNPRIGSGLKYGRRVVEE
jgi:hypothetical protein